MAKARRKRPAILKPEPDELFELEQAVDELCGHVRALNAERLACAIGLLGSFGTLALGHDSDPV